MMPKKRLALHMYNVDESLEKAIAEQEAIARSRVNDSFWNECGVNVGKDMLRAIAWVRMVKKACPEALGEIGKRHYYARSLDYIAANYDQIGDDRNGYGASLIRSMTFHVLNTCALNEELGVGE